MNRLALIALVVSFAVASAGCQRMTTTYGESSGGVGQRSLNGFGALRNTYESAGYQDRDVRRLTVKTKKAQVIVWTPQSPMPIANDVTRWFEGWFRTGTKTLVYVLPDSGSETEYWTTAAAAAPPEQRFEYRRRAARHRNQRAAWANNRATISSNGWFVAKPKSQLSNVEALSSEDWSFSASAGETLLTEYVIEPYGQKKTPANAATPAAGGAAPAPAAAAPNRTTGPTGPSAPFTMNSSVKASSTKAGFRSLLKSESGDTIIAEITSDRWNSSRIIVVASGSLLTNFAFTREFNVNLADTIVEESKSGLSISPPSTRNSPTAGFLTSSYLPISVSERQSSVPAATGMELLTVWPLSLITIHALLLGFVICMIMFPIFGRPRTVDRGTTSSFADHLDAVASLMNRARGERYAKARISEYMRRMKGETSGKWVLPETPKPNLQKSKKAVVAVESATSTDTPDPSKGQTNQASPGVSQHFDADTDETDNKIEF